jgi:hypothetical protein
MRAFASLEERDELEETFYGGAAWQTGPREAILSRIESYHTVVLEVSDAAITALGVSVS